MLETNVGGNGPHIFTTSHKSGTWFHLLFKRSRRSHPGPFIRPLGDTRKTEDLTGMIHPKWV